MFDFSTILRTLGGSLAGILLTVSGCITGLTATGCAFGKMTPQAFDQAMEAGDKLLTAAKEMGLEADVQGGYTGKGGVSQDSAINVDLGLQVMFHAKNNPMMHLYMRQLGLTEKLIAQNQQLIDRLIPVATSAQ